MKNKSGLAAAGDLSPILFEPKEVAKTFKEVGVDFLRVEAQDIRSRWLRGQHDSDLFLWQDSHENLLKTQVTFLGQIVEWNAVEGTKTGIVVEQEAPEEQSGEPKIQASEVIVFDRHPQPSAVKTALALISNIEAIDSKLKNYMLDQLSGQKQPPGLPKDLTLVAVKAVANQQQPGSIWSAVSRILSRLKLR